MLRIKNLTKTFPGVYAPVLNNINLTINNEDFCVIIGANGSGKSTLLKLISGEYLPDGGIIESHGKIAQVVQDINLGTIAEMTLLENMALSSIAKPKLRFFNRYKQQVMNNINSLHIGLDKYVETELKCLSGGQRQALAILMAINTGCRILLLDEHTSALDPKTQSIMMKHTAEQINIHKFTCLMITHKLDDAIQYGNRLIMLHKGKIVLDLSGTDKKNLQLSDLLALFHQYEDNSLLSGDKHEN